MSAAAINGVDGLKSNPPAAPASAAKPPQLRSSNSGKALDTARRQTATPVDPSNRKQQPRAWQGTNPITQRAPPSNVPNGDEKSVPKAPSPALHIKSSGDLQADRHAHDRSLFLFAQFIGKDVTITLKNGEQFAGVFSSGSLESSRPQYVVKMARRTGLPSHQQMNGNTILPHEYVGEGVNHAMSFDIQDTSDLHVTDVSTAAANIIQNGSIGSSFLTDTQISTKETPMLRERDLQRWKPGPDDLVDMSLESSGTAEWDQFAVNERMYGVQSTYDENIYTMPIDRSNPRYKQVEANAERLAREIEESLPANSHVAEERRRDAHRDDAGGDEEEKYSGVRREATTLPRRAAGAYIPPSQRPVTGAPTVSGAPFDPAIISAQLSRPSEPPSGQGRDREPSVAQADPAQTHPVDQNAQVIAPSASGDSGLSAQPVANPPKKKENTTEDRVRDTADAFKQFAVNEKLRIRQVQEAKRSTLRQEKNVKLNDLKKFAANFKLKSRVPDDLVPILAKDREKQIEIQSKAEEAAKEEEIKAKERSSDKASTAATSPTPSVALLQPAPGMDQATPYSHRVRGSQQMRPPPLPGHGQTASPRAPLGQRIHSNLMNRAAADLRVIPAIPAPLPSELGPLSPNSAIRLNVNAKAFEFRPGASAFTPTGTSPSPQRSTRSAVAQDAPAAFFSEKDKSRESKAFSSAFDPLKRMAEADYDEMSKKKFVSNGGFPQAYNTPPTWPCSKANESVSYLSAFPQIRATSQGPSPMHTPKPNMQQMPHHQHPAHMQASNMSTPSHRQHYYAQPQHGHVPSFDPRLQFGPNGSVQNSPRAPQQMPVAPFNGQMPPMPMQQFPGQPMPGYSMSPSVQYRQPVMQGGPMMLPGQQQGQMGMQPGYPPGPHFRGPQMGGHMMVQQGSSGGYGNGTLPQPGFSPMPPHAQPHMGHMQQHGPAGYSGSPRPPMMQHQGSHQGFQPGMQMHPHFVPSPGQPPHPYHMQQRAMSGGYPQMTPRQQHAVPNHSSPGMGVPGQGDEGK